MLVQVQQAERVVQHLLVEVGDAPAGFGRGQDLPGRQQGAVALAQAQQHLVLRGVATGDGDDRLVGRFQLAFEHGDAAQVLFLARRRIQGHALRVQARLQRGALDRLQHAAGVFEALRQVGVADRAAQVHRLVVA